MGETGNGIIDILKKSFILLGLMEEGESLFNVILDLLSDSIDFEQDFQDKYGWGTSTGFQHASFLENLKQLFIAINGKLNRDHSVYDPTFQVIQNSDPDFKFNNLPCNEQEELLHIPLLTYSEDSTDSEIDLKVLPLPTENSATDAGLAVVPYGMGSVTKTFALNDLWKLFLELNGNVGEFGLIIRPDLLEFQDLNTPSNFTNFDISALLKRESPNQIPAITLGNPDRTHLELGTLGIKILLRYYQNQFEYILSFPIEDGRIVIKSSEGDGFLQKILPKDPITLDFALSPAYSNLIGFHFDGSSSLELNIPINKNLGPIFINCIDLEFEIDGTLLEFTTAVTGGLEVGPFTGVVEKIGLITRVDLGSETLPDFSFKPPTGVGLAIDANGIAGGGYLSIDPPNYTGILDLSIKNKFSITAIALITTQLPNNRPGFSFLLSLMGQFNPGIQLGYGFVLSGIGGIVGINRRMNKDALMEAQRTHSLDHVLFPEDPIRNATAIIASLSNIFPPEDGYYVFGPMVKIFWGGVHPLVDFDVGIFIEFGGDGLVALVGTAHAALPTEEASVILLNLDILGIIDFGEKSLDIRASLFDSAIAKKFILSGDMALKANWGDNPDFALSIGGWHPRFNPPPDFPELKRLSISLGTGNPRISLSCYLAITTNTFQTGAILDLYAGVGNFSASAAIGFDALIRFNPFMFDVGVYGRAAIKYKKKKVLSCDLDLNLKGPNPYHAKGHAAFAFLCWDIKIKFDKTFGDTLPEDQERVSPVALLKDALSDKLPIYELPNWADEGVNLTEDAASFLSPIGNILITQNAVPLDFEMDKCGVGVPPEDEKVLMLDIISNDNIEELEDVPKQNFAPSLFKSLTDDEKLSAPAFEKFNSGIRIGGRGKIPGETDIDKRLMEYETILINHEEEDLQTAEFTYVGRFSLVNLEKNSARLLMKSWAMQGSQKYAKPTKKIINKKNNNYVELKEPKFTVTVPDSVNNQFVRTSIGGTKCSDMTFSQARDLCKLIQDPELQVVNSIFAESMGHEKIGG
ncbi:MAG: DUF6603 domain-containing protein [Promethearchaeota archaeon]